MPHKILYKVTDGLFHKVSDYENGTYTLSLYFNIEEYYKMCLKALNGKFQIKDEGSLVMANKTAYHLSVLGLTRHDMDTKHGFVSYTVDNKYIRVYWNNNNRRIEFYLEA